MSHGAELSNLPDHALTTLALCKYYKKYQANFVILLKLA